MIRFAYLCFILSVAQISIAQIAVGSEFINKFVERDVFKHATISASVLEINSDKEILSFQKDKVLVPASSLKLFTTFTALHILGEDFTYKTDVNYVGHILKDGTLEGDIYITGSGDPTLGSSKFSGYPNFQDLLLDIVNQIKKIGISCVTKNIIADESIFNSYPISPSWQWNDLGNYYAGGAWGINVNDNQYYIFFGQQAAEGMVPKLKRYGPKIPNLILHNEVETGPPGSGDQAYIFGGPYNYTKRIVGTIPPGTKEFIIKGSIPDPPLFMAYHIQYALQKQKIKVDGYKTLFEWAGKKPKFNTIASYESPRLSAIVKKINAESNNLYCEALLKTIGQKTSNQGSGTKGIQSIEAYMKSLSVDISGMRMDDGSGLSTRNAISSYMMADFLKGVANTIGLETATSYLPKAGLQGTVKSLLKNSPAKGRVWAKSGSMEGIMSYSGYIKTKSGKWMSYSIIVNGFPDKLKKLRTELQDFLEGVYQL